MDGHQFDALTRTLAQGTGRRTVLKLLGGGLIVGLGNALGVRRVDAEQPCDADRLCATKDDCCDRDICLNGRCTPAATLAATCTPGQPCGTNADCGCLGEACLEGRCRCAGTLCRGVCTDLSRDDRNCGACGTACPSGSACCGGTCVLLGTTTNCLTCGDACTDDGNACTGASVCDPVLGCQHPPLANRTTCTTSTGTSGLCQDGVCTDGMCTEYWGECEFWDDTDACRRDCAQCEAQGGEMCGYGFSVSPLCCPAGEVCHRSRHCCSTEKVCGMECCGPTGECNMALNPDDRYCI